MEMMDFGGGRRGKWKLFGGGGEVEVGARREGEGLGRRRR